MAVLVRAQETVQESPRQAWILVVVHAGNLTSEPACACEKSVRKGEGRPGQQSPGPGTHGFLPQEHADFDKCQQVSRHNAPRHSTRYVVRWHVLYNGSLRNARAAQGWHCVRLCDVNSFSTLLGGDSSDMTVSSIRLLPFILATTYSKLPHDPRVFCCCIHFDTGVTHFSGASYGGKPYSDAFIPHLPGRSLLLLLLHPRFSSSLETQLSEYWS